MVNYDLAASNLINKYIWRRLQDELGWVTIPDPEGMMLVPIFPAQQQPEFAASPHPYLVYGYSINNSGEDGIHQEQITYTVYGDELTVRTTVNFLDSIFMHYDWSADDVNAFVELTDVDPKYGIYDFKTIWRVDAIGPQPADTEGGPLTGAVVIRAEYTRSIPNNQVSGAMNSDDPMETSYRKMLTQP